MTDRHTFGTPFDAGCAWIYQADHNPLTAIARRHGFDLLQHDAAPERLYSEIGRSTASAKLRYADAGRRLTLNLRGLGSTGRDVPAAVAMAKPPDGWDRLAANWIGPLDTGADMDEFSAVDWWNLDLTWPYFLVKQGYGSVIASFGEGIPVRTSTTVSAIHWGDAEGVRVETSGGTIRAKACIITVSTGVLRAERIRFDPPLPPEKISAIDGLPMGLLAKIPLQFDGARFGLPANGWLSYSADSEEIASFLTWPFDNNLIIGFVGGRFAWELTGAGEEVAIDFALTQLRKILGSTVDQHFVKGAFTRWGRNPNVMGAFAYARPGAALARDALAQPLNNRLWFAGEALGGGMAMTCGGAFASGLRVEADVSKWVIDTKRLYGRRMVGDEVVALPL
jgi:monoamine oxidase